MKGFSIRLRKYYLSASNTEKVVIDTILKEPAKIVGISIHELAKVAYSSASTITRLCHNLGYDNYKAFQQALLYETAFINETSLKIGAAIIEKNDSLENIIDKITFNNIKSLEDTKKILDKKSLEKTIDILRKAKKIAFFGIGASYLVATDAYLKFLRVNKIIMIAEDWHSQYLHANNLGKNDVAMIFSYSGQTMEMIKCAEKAKENGASVIVVTGFFDTPLSKLADINLYVASVEYVVRKGAMTSRIAQLNVVDIIFTKYINDNYDYYNNKIIRSQILKPREEN